MEKSSKEQEGLKPYNFLHIALFNMKKVFSERNFGVSFQLRNELSYNS